MRKSKQMFANRTIYYTAFYQFMNSQGQSYGSVYLLPFARQGEEESGQSPSGYRYSIVGTNQPSGEKHFYTLR